MVPRVTFFFIAAFWVTMNVLLWRAEYGSHGGEISVPVDLVWRKILTAPDVSALTIYQDRRRAGFCEVSTSVEQAMAALDENTVPPEGLAAQSGYQIHFNGNLSFGAITNRVRFDGRLQFSSARAWRELNLKVSTQRCGGGHSFRRGGTNRALQNHQRGSELRARPEFCRLAESQCAVARAGRRVGQRMGGRTGFARDAVLDRLLLPTPSNGKHTGTGS